MLIVVILINDAFSGIVHLTRRLHIRNHTHPKLMPIHRRLKMNKEFMMFIYSLHGQDVFSHACSLSSISEAHIRQVTSQLLCAIDYLQSRHIVHCDIKVDIVAIQVNINFTVISKIGFTVPVPKCKLCTGCVGLMSSPISGARPSCLSKSHNGHTGKLFLPILS